MEKTISEVSGETVFLRKSLINPTPPGMPRNPRDYYSYWFKSVTNPGTQSSYYDNFGGGGETTFSRYINTGEMVGGISMLIQLGTNQAPITHPLYAQAVSEAKSKLFKFTLDGRKSSFNVLVSLAEADKTVHMITITATRVFAFYKAIRKGRLGEAYRSLGISQHQSVLTHRLLLDEYRRGITSKTSRIKHGARRYPRPKTVRENAAGYVLETQYGWMPLLQDIKSGAEKIAAIVQDDATPVVIRARASKLSSSERTGDFYGGTPWNQITVDSVRVQYVLRYRFTDGYLAQAASLGLTNPASLIWEVIPLSFVIDWLVPVGKYLESLSAFHGLDFRSCTLSATRNCKSMYTAGIPLADVVYAQANADTWFLKRKIAYTGGNVIQTYGGFTRVVLSDFPSAEIGLESKNFTWSKLATVAALLQQRSPNKGTRL